MERWNSWASYAQKRYGHRLYRVALDGNFTCPNRDGTIGTGGCIFCSGRGSGEFALAYHGQKLAEEDLIYNRRKDAYGRYIGYLQAFTSTYGPMEKLRRLYTGILENPLFAGIDIGTRPDCLGKDVLALLSECRNAYPDQVFMVELGLQTMHEQTASAIHRGYSLPVFAQAVHDLRQIGIDVIVHVIFGLPGENEEMMMDTIRYLNGCDIQGIKISSLQFIEGTLLAEKYRENPEKYRMLSREEYVHLAAEALGYLRPDIVVHRITGDGDQKTLIGPMWAVHKGQVINAIRHEMKEMDLVQGCLWKQ